MKIGICYLSIGEHYKKCTKWSKINKINYCKKHNYDFIEDDSVYDNSRTIPWSKINLLLKYIDNYDYLVWMDADLLIMNDEIKLEDIINKYTDYNMIIGSDYRMPNTGTMFVKNSTFSKKFLEFVLENKYDKNGSYDGRYDNHEQGSIINLIDKNFQDCQSNLKITEPREFNSYWYNYHPNDFIFHFAGATSDLQMFENLFLIHYPTRLIDENGIMHESEESYLTRKSMLDNWREVIKHKL